MSGRYSNYFLLAAIGYFETAAFLGLLMLLSRMGHPWQAWDYYIIPSHTHLMLLGWVSMTIYAMMYRVVPSFFSRRLYSEKLAWVHFGVANAATLGMALFFWLNRWQEGQWSYALAAAGGLQIVGALIFGFNMIASVMSGPDKIELFSSPQSKR